MTRSTPIVPCLFVEGRKLRPTSLRVLQALHRLGARPSVVQDGVTTAELVEATGLTAHVVRARLCDLRRRELVESDLCPQIAPRGVQKRHAHYLTVEGERRVAVD